MWLRFSVLSAFHLVIRNQQTRRETLVQRQEYACALLCVQEVLVLASLVIFVGKTRCLDWNDEFGCKKKLGKPVHVPELMEGGDVLRRLRKQRGITQEKLAEEMHVEVRTIQRWEAGSAKPGIHNAYHLRDRLQKANWQDYPFCNRMLEKNSAVALLDGFAVYQKANTKFQSFYYGFAALSVEGVCAVDLFDFWRFAVPRIAGMQAAELSASNIVSIDYSMVDTISGSGVPIRHQVFVVRQKHFSTMLVHEVSRLPSAALLDGEPIVVRRTA
jgi:transcriptional regulator with XRE-family HTH domain